MLVLILLSSLLCMTRVDAQGLLSGIRGQQSPLDRLPGFGACDRIASRGVANCYENFLPKNALSGITGGSRGGSGSGGNICCSYSKYRACISGLHTGLRIAMQQERCPNSYSARIIKSLGESNVGPLKSMCENASTGSSQCPKNKQSTKPKKNKKKPTSNSNRRTDNRERDESLGGLNPLGGAGFNPLGAGGLNPLGGNGGFNPLGGGGLGGGLGGFNPLGGGLIPSGSNPGLDIFGGGRGGSNRGTGDRQQGDILGPVRDVVQRGTETFQQGMSTLLGGAQSVFGGLTGGRNGGGFNGGGGSRNRDLDRFE